MKVASYGKFIKSLCSVKCRDLFDCTEKWRQFSYNLHAAVVYLEGNHVHNQHTLILFYSYEERAKSLETVVRNHKDATTFEEFTAQVYSPVQPVSPFCPGPNRSSGKHCML